MTQDLIDRLVPLTPGDALYLTRHQRDKVVAATQGSHNALFDPDLPGLNLGERLHLALSMAQTAGNNELSAFYAQSLRQHGAVQDSGRLAAARSFAHTLTVNPVAADRVALLSLPAAGFSTAEAVALAQLVAYVSYQIRVLAGLQAMKALGATSAQPPCADEQPFVHPAHLPPPGAAVNVKGFTSATLGWRAWLPVLNLEQATPQQLAVLDSSHPTARSSDYYLLLGHQPRILQERSSVFNAIMYAPGGVSRAERELASAVVSRVNGCVYCASVHAQRFEQLTKRNDVIAQVFEDPDTAGTHARERAIVQASVALTRSPEDFSAEAIQSLRDQGLGDLEVLDLIHAIAIFAWANRLMLNLGEPVQGP
jgi:uncharacterized peroxidase-related enzyme